MERAGLSTKHVFAGLLTAALCAAVVAALLVVPGLVGAASVPAGSVDVNAAVTQESQCSSCHDPLNAADTDKPGVIYRHGSKGHETTTCQSCHWGAPHTQAGQTPLKHESCFVSGCHDLPYAKGSPIEQNQLVREKNACLVCHDTSFNLRPSDHGAAAFNGTGHAAPAKTDSNACLTCHDPKGFCDACHAKTAPKLAATAAYQPVGAPKPVAQRQALIQPNAPTTMSQCVVCHPDLDAFKAGRVSFKHGTHLARSFPCAACHTTFAHKPGVVGGVTRPLMQACYACHGTSHVATQTPSPVGTSVQKTIAVTTCATCHPGTFTLKPVTHTTAFVTKEHPKSAKADPKTCAMCHERSFCVSCHQGKPKAAGGPARKRVVPADHTGVSIVRHGIRYRQANAQCSACHEASTCLRCHKTPVPHAPDWTSQHGLLKTSDPKDCAVCHKDRSRCQKCHHQGLENATLVSDKCVKCHPTIADKVGTVTNQALAEHGAHFKAAKTFGRLLVCNDCHVDFKLTPGAQMTSTTKGHDVRLCFSCHGAKDKAGKLKAPYPGKDLCVRCHKEQLL